MVSFKSLIAVGVIGVMIGVLSVVNQAQAAATFPGDNGSLAATNTTTDGKSIWRITGPGEKIQLVAGGSRPVWSPLGSELLYGTEDGQLRRMNVDGTGQRDFSAVVSSHESSPAWTSDGQRVAFVREQTLPLTSIRRSAVIVRDMRSGQEAAISGWLYFGRFNSPSWSPDGSRLVYEKETNNKRQLIIKHSVSGNARVLVTLSDNIDSNVSWSPNGHKILYNDSASEVYTIWTDGSRRTIISDGESYDASWSPDGKRIVFLEDRHGDEISISQEDGTVSWLPVQKESYDRLASPVWSPDGMKLAFLMQYGNGADGVSDVFTRDTTTEAETVWMASGNFSDLNWQPLTRDVSH